MAKKIYESVKVVECPRCKSKTKHAIFNYDLKLYRCNICGSIHPIKN